MYGSLGLYCSLNFFSGERDTIKKGDRNADTVVGLNTVLTGNIEAQDSVCVEGTVMGNLKCRSMVIIGVKGRIEGDVEAAAAIIGGTVKGNVKVEELLEMLKSAAVLGDISTSRLQVAPGAVLKGRCSMTPR